MGTYVYAKAERLTEKGWAFLCDMKVEFYGVKHVFGDDFLPFFDEMADTADKNFICEKIKENSAWWFSMRKADMIPCAEKLLRHCVIEEKKLARDKCEYADEKREEIGKIRMAAYDLIAASYELDATLSDIGDYTAHGYDVRMHFFRC